MAGPPATGVAETVKLSGADPQLVQPTVRVADASKTEMAEIVAIGFEVTTTKVEVWLSWPLYETVA